MLDSVIACLPARMSLLTRDRLIRVAFAAVVLLLSFASLTGSHALAACGDYLVTGSTMGGDHEGYRDSSARHVSHANDGSPAVPQRGCDGPWCSRSTTPPLPVPVSYRPGPRDQLAPFLSAAGAFHLDGSYRFEAPRVRYPMRIACRIFRPPR
jgi:hypothetical protein